MKVNRENSSQIVSENALARWPVGTFSGALDTCSKIEERVEFSVPGEPYDICLPSSRRP